MLALLALAFGASAADLEQDLTWNLDVQGQRLGTRTLKIKYVKGEDSGTRRILESFTQLDGNVGPIRVVFRQRMTAHAAGREPASFHSVVDHNGTPQEVQARWTPSAWWVTTNVAGRQRTVDMPLNRIDISTADLMDPETRFPMSHFDTLRLLSAETGEVAQGPVTQLGVSGIDIGGTDVQVHGYAWDGPQGRSEFYFSADGFLVRYNMQILGIEMEAQLTKPPPGGLDDFPVAVGAPEVEVIPL